MTKQVYIHPYTFRKKTVHKIIKNQRRLQKTCETVKGMHEMMKRQ